MEAVPMDPDYSLFAEVVKAGSLSGAARRLHISPAMVSRRIARLEEKLGVPLLVRTTRSLALTRAGEAFYAELDQILARLESAVSTLKGQATRVAGRLRVSAPTSFGRLYVAPYVKAFLDAHPQIELQLDLSDAYQDLAAEKIDLAIRIGASVAPGLSAHRLGSSPRVLCAAPAFIAEHGAPRSISDLGKSPLVAADGQLPWRLDGPGGPVVIQGVSRVQTNSSEVARELALAGAGVALRSLWDVGREIRAGRLVRILPDYAGAAGAAIYAVHAGPVASTGAVAAFIAHMKAAYEPRPPWEEEGLT